MILHQEIDKLSLELDNLKTVEIYPDAGDVLNKNVMERWERVCNLLEGWGYTPVIQWWNQLSKECADIDELKEYDGIRAIAPKEFWKIARIAQAQAKREETLRQQQFEREQDDLRYQQLNSI